MTTQGKKLSLCGPIKANLSTTSTGSTGIVYAYTWISANHVSRSSPIDDWRYVFSRLRVEKERSGVAVVGKVTSTCSRMDRFGYRDALHVVYASSAADDQRYKLQDKVKGYKNASSPVQSIGYAAAYPAYPRNPSLCMRTVIPLLRARV